MIGERIRHARLTSGMTQDEVVAALGLLGVSLTKAGLSKYEREKSCPRASLVLNLAKVFAVPLDTMMRESSMSVCWIDSHVDTLPDRIRERVLAQVIDQVEKYLWIREALSLGDEALSFPTRQIVTVEEAEEAAVWLRELWQLGTQPIQSMVQLLEDKGFTLLAFGKEKDDFDGFSGWISYRNSEIPVIAFNSAQTPDRIRICLGQALGRLALRLPVKQKEQIVCRFAAAFLVPRNVVVTEVGEKRSHLDLAELALLQQRYGLSMKAWVGRIRDLGIISKSLCQALVGRQGSSEYVNSNERCYKLFMMTWRALSEGYISAERAEQICPGAFQDQVDACRKALRDELIYWEKNGGTPPARLWHYLPKEVRNSLMRQAAVEAH